MPTHDELRKRYKETPIPMGVFLVRHLATNDYVLGTSRNLEGALNRFRFSLKLGNPNDPLLKNPKILDDYRAGGEAAFEFKVLDTIKPKDEPGWNPADDLQALEKMWREDLAQRGWKAY